MSAKIEEKFATEIARFTEELKADSFEQLLRALETEAKTMAKNPWHTEEYEVAEFTVRMIRTELNNRFTALGGNVSEFPTV